MKKRAIIRSNDRPILLVIVWKLVLRCKALHYKILLRMHMNKKWGLPDFLKFRKLVKQFKSDKRLQVINTNFAQNKQRNLSLTEINAYQQVLFWSVIFSHFISVALKNSE
jgi:hypothetical protein